LNIRVIAAVVLILAALGLGVLAEQVLTHRATARAAVAAGPVTQVIVAAHPLPAGTLARETDFTMAVIRGRPAPANAIIYSKAAIDSLDGALVRDYIETGAIVSRSDILRPRDRGFLAAVLRPGARAISIPVNIVTGVSGLIWPGDHVDLLLTENVNGGTTPIADQIFTNIVLHDIRVIAIGQSIVQGAAGNPKASAAASNQLYQTVTLEVTPLQAEKIVVAQRLGTLSLIVRAARAPRAGIDPNPADSTVFASTVSPALAQSTRPIGQRMNLIQGGTRQEISLP
jgi:pilus assembly protein CpaB